MALDYILDLAAKRDAAGVGELLTAGPLLWRQGRELVTAPTELCSTSPAVVAWLRDTVPERTAYFAEVVGIRPTVTLLFSLDKEDAPAAGDVLAAILGALLTIEPGAAALESPVGSLMLVRREEGGELLLVADSEDWWTPPRRAFLPAVSRFAAAP